jgi:hypothetical protein
MSVRKLIKILPHGLRLGMATKFMRASVFLMPRGVDCRDVLQGAVVDRAFDPDLKPWPEDRGVA